MTGRASLSFRGGIVVFTIILRAALHAQSPKLALSVFLFPPSLALTLPVSLAPSPALFYFCFARWSKPVLDRPLMAFPEDDILKYAGFDAAIFLRFYAVAFKVRPTSSMLPRNTLLEVDFFCSTARSERMEESRQKCRQEGQGRGATTPGGVVEILLFSRARGSSAQRSRRCSCGEVVHPRVSTFATRHRTCRGDTCNGWRTVRVWILHLTQVRAQSFHVLPTVTTAPPPPPPPPHPDVTAPPAKRCSPCSHRTDSWC